jgi:hypothetical protein
MSGPFCVQVTPVINTTTTSRETRTGVTTSVVEEFSESRADRVVSTNLAQTVRSRAVTVTGENFKPNTPYYIFFDGIDVGQYVQPSSTTYAVGGATPADGVALRSDNTGAVSAVFTIPNTSQLNFTTGIKTLKVTDSSSNASDTLSQGTSQYSANGELTTIQEQIVSTRNARVIREEISDSRMASNTRVSGGTVLERRQPVRWTDPLAQSFLVDVVGGVFITSVELYVGAKDTALPITVQLRHMENGMPTQKILPFGEKTLAPASVTTTSDASTSTKFTFPSPVFLESGREYCAVIMSNSNVYTCWVSEMGQKDIQTNDFIDQQPYAGVLFKSQNNSTWTADQLRDLKMKINRAKFTTGTAASVIFENDSLGTDTLETNPIEIITGTKTFRVSHYSHGNYDQNTSNITIAGVKGDRLTSFIGGSTAAGGAAGVATSISNSTTDCSSKTISSSNSSAKLPVFGNVTVVSNLVTAAVITDPGSGFAVGDTITIADVTGSDDIVFTLVAGDISDTLGGIPIGYINTAHAAGVENFDHASGSKIMADIDEYKIRIKDSVWVTGIANAVESVYGGGDSVTATYNAYFDTIQTAIPSIELPNTVITSTFLATTATQPVLNSTQNAYVKDSVSTTLSHNDNTFLSASKIVASDVNQSEMGNAKSFQIQSQLSSTANNVSPVLDVDTMGAIVIQNRINNVDSSSDVQAGTHIPSTDARGDNNAAVYCTKKVQLKNDANAIHVLFDGFRPPHGTTDPTIDVYYKVAGADSALQFNDIGWVLATIKESVPADSSDFKEYTYEIESLESFTTFSIKVVLQSIDSANVPMVENFRAIALSN